MSLVGAGLLTSTLASAADEPNVDMIVLADYSVADSQTTLLSELGFKLVRATATPTPESSDVTTGTTSPASESPAGTGSAASPLTTPTATPAASGAVSTTLPVTATAGVTTTVTPTTTQAVVSSPTATPTPQVLVYLEKQDGLRLLAAQTVIIAQHQFKDGHHLVTVLGNDSTGIRAGVDRLLTHTYTGCVTGSDIVICSYEGGKESASGTSVSTTKTKATPAPTPTTTGAAAGTSTPEAGGNQGTNAILVIDDNKSAAANETSEADMYIQFLTQLSYQPALWNTAQEGAPTAVKLANYKWVIWSAGGYEAGGPGLGDLDALLAYINKGGHLTISSRRPFFGMGGEAPSVIADVVVDQGYPELVTGLPTTTIQLANGLPPVTPLEVTPESNGPKVALRRGPDSANANAPLLFSTSDQGQANATGAQLVVLGMSLTWLPADNGKQLVRNMATVMLGQ